MKYHAIKTMKANENGQILRGPPTPIFFNILAYIKYSFLTIKLTTVAHTV
jgi:hypothetical protein